MTVAEFARFTQETGYATVAERYPAPQNCPGVGLQMLVPGAPVFTGTDRPVPLNDPAR